MKTEAIEWKLTFEAKLVCVWKEVLGLRKGEAVAALEGSDGEYQYFCTISRKRKSPTMTVSIDDELGFTWILQQTFEVNRAGELDNINVTFKREQDAQQERIVEMARRLEQAGEEFFDLFPPYPEARRTL